MTTRERESGTDGSAVAASSGRLAAAEISDVEVRRLLDGLPEAEPLTAFEADYVAAARAENTKRGYASDLREFTAWCQAHELSVLPAADATLTAYLADLAAVGATVGTMRRRISSIRFVHQRAGLPDPTATARFTLVWDGIRRTHGAPPNQAKALRPPTLFDVLDACPVTRVWKTRNRAPGPDLAGARDRALLLVGFVGALRRSELVALRVRDVRPHDLGLVLVLPRSKTNQTGEQADLVIIPRAERADRCPVIALDRWLTLAGINELGAPVFQGVTKANKATGRRLHPESVNALVQQAISRAGIDPADYSAHSLRAGFVTHAHQRGATTAAIAKQTRHRSLATVDGYIRLDGAWIDNAATRLGF